ncbi:hypothetical protein ACE939_14235 [Aquimarina sp. W85]|uniref:hypothetical protein n=1 Tax=Aquimarina rhodophyticola TaxID=3342246 RepID=UPI003672BEF0
MKKLPYLFLAVISLVSAQGIQAQEENEIYDTNTIKTIERLNFTAIEIVELPMIIQDKAATDFEDYRIKEAFISDNKHYKIVLVNKNSITKVMYASPKGKWIKPDDKS